MRNMETAGLKRLLTAATNTDSAALDDQKGSPNLARELARANLVAVKTLADICIAPGVSIETQVLAAKTILEYKPETVRLT